MSRKILGSNTDRILGVKERTKSQAISVFLSWLPGVTLNKKWEVF